MGFRLKKQKLYLRAEDLGAIEITPSGYGLHWEALDVDLSVPSLLKGIYGTRAWMEQLQSVSR